MASFLASAFIALRLVYAVVFGGASTPGKQLFSIPELSLIGPFRHITLFGSVTAEGLLQNVITALPFAAVILGFGFMASLIRPSQLINLSRKALFGQKLVMAIAIGWAQLPSLVDAIKRISFATRLRGEKKHRMLIPVLETAAARALALATRISIENTKSVAAPMLMVEDLQVGNVVVPELSIKPGQLVVITGPTAAGKTSLLLAISGLAEELGVVTQGSVSAAGSIGYLPQQPRDSIWGPSVKDELPAESGIGFESMADLEIQHLSEGEAVRLVLARELSRKPQILLLDEPYASLDEQMAIKLTKTLRDYLAGGGIAIVVEHRTDYLEALSPQWQQIADGVLKPGKHQAASLPLARLQPVVGSDLILDRKISRVFAGQKLLIKDVKLQISQAQAVSISGPNGSGKTSLLKAITAKNDPSVVAMVPEVVSDFFVTQTLEEELARADRVAGVRQGFTKASFDSICSDLEINVDTHPRDLSHGTQLALAISMQLSHKPKLLLIDEPVKGFDPETKQRVAETLKCVLETGTAIIFATHDSQFAQDLAHQHLAVENQCLVPMSGVLR